MRDDHAGGGSGRRPEAQIREQGGRMKVTVLGATGKLGSLVVPVLVAAGHDVRAITRRSETIDDLNATGAHAVLVDLESDDLDAAFAGVDAVVWAAGANLMTGTDHSERVDRDGAISAIAAAEAAGVKHWVQVSSLYADRADEGPEPLRPFLHNKAAADAAVEASSMTWTVLRPGGLTEEAGTGSVTVGPQTGFIRISRADVAAVIAESLVNDAASGKAFDVGAGQTPISDAISSL
jgi:uncharacterized protein YbjT (DUF2867 family)